MAEFEKVRPNLVINSDFEVVGEGSIRFEKHANGINIFVKMGDQSDHENAVSKTYTSLADLFDNVTPVNYASELAAIRALLQIVASRTITDSSYTPKV
jgi:hypothetical protein